MQPDPPLRCLAFDCSQPHCAIAFLEGDALSTAIEPMAKGQAERLLPLVSCGLAERSWSWEDITAIGVGIGPGNFTGTRIAVAAARGLAMGCGIPAVGVTTLEAMAFGTDGRVSVAVNGPRDQLYVQAFENGRAESGPSLVALDQAQTSSARLGDWPGGTAVPTETWIGHMARITAARAPGETPPPAPLYLRPADAALPSEAPPRILNDA